MARSTMIGVASSDVITALTSVLARASPSPGMSSSSTQMLVREFGGEQVVLLDRRAARPQVADAHRGRRRGGILQQVEQVEAAVRGALGEVPVGDGAATAVSACAPYAGASHDMVRSTTSGWSDSTSSRTPRRQPGDRLGVDRDARVRGHRHDVVTGVADARERQRRGGAMGRGSAARLRVEERGGRALGEVQVWAAGGHEPSCEAASVGGDAE